MDKKKIAALAVAVAVLVGGVAYGCVFGGKIQSGGDVRKITSAGSYTFSGEINGKIKVEAGTDDEIEIVLAGVNITNPDGPCIKVATAGAVKLVLLEGTDNILKSGSEANPTGDGSSVNSNADLTVAGSGSLVVYGYNNNGIHSKKNLVIDDGNLSVYANGDCIQADGNMTVAGGCITVATLGVNDASDLNTKSDGFDFGGFGGGLGRPERTSGGGFEMPDGFDRDEVIRELEKNVVPERPRDNQNERPGNETEVGESSSDSQKGLKANGKLAITGGTVKILTQDDAVHCNDEMEISGGKLILASGDDGIHADESIVISNADIDVQKSYEGIEAHHITINSGSLSVVASDDGFNANGGSNNIGQGGGFGGFGRMFGGGESGSDNDMPSIIINGGSVYVNAQGDGLDSNGNLTINGGTVIVDGPSSGANGALDCGSENGGTLLVNGGTVLAIGASGMAESPESDSRQAFVYQNVSFSAGSVIRIVDESGTELITHTAAKSGGNIVFSSPQLKEGTIQQINIL